MNSERQRHTSLLNYVLFLAFFYSCAFFPRSVAFCFVFVGRFFGQAALFSILFCRLAAISARLNTVTTAKWVYYLYYIGSVCNVWYGMLYAECVCRKKTNSKVIVAFTSISNWISSLQITMANCLIVHAINVVHCSIPLPHIRLHSLIPWRLVHCIRNSQRCQNLELLAAEMCDRMCSAPLAVMSPQESKQQPNLSTFRLFGL